jgi:protein required for attachment to host cells
MGNYCVLVADRAKARFFVLEESAMPELESSPTLVEREVLSNAEATMSGREKFSDAKSGRNTGAAGAHGYDDHRSNHDNETSRRFAQQVADKALTLARQTKAYHLVITAEKQMLGTLRQALNGSNGSQLDITEVAKDLTRFSPGEIHRYLADDGIVPAQKKPTRQTS